MARSKEHEGLKTLENQFNDGKMSRREFIRYSTLLGVSATTAYSMVGMVAPRPVAAADMPRGGTVRIAMRVPEIANPHTYQWIYDSNQGRGTHEYLTKTGQDNVTRPYLIEKWEASEDLKTWTMHLRSVKWHDGRDFTADDAIWNLEHCLDPNTGSSVLGLMKGYMLEEYDTGEKKEDGSAKMSTRLWDANALEKVDERTFRMNLKEPQVAVPEHLFHYPLPMLDPAEGGNFGPGSNGPVPSISSSRKWERRPCCARAATTGAKARTSTNCTTSTSGTMHRRSSAHWPRNRFTAVPGDVGQLDVLGNLPTWRSTRRSLRRPASLGSRWTVRSSPIRGCARRCAWRWTPPRCLELAHRIWVRPANTTMVPGAPGLQEAALHGPRPRGGKAVARGSRISERGRHGIACLKDRHGSFRQCRRWWSSGRTPASG